MTALLVLALLQAMPGNDRVDLQPLGRIEQSTMVYLARELADRFSVTVRILHPHELPGYAWYANRKQFAAPAILDSLGARHRSLLTGEPEPGRVLAVIEADLSAPGMNFVFGQADMVDRVAVVSLCRLREEYYCRSADRAKTLGRLVREAVHEIGHTYGLGHCANPDCVMCFSNRLDDTDRKSSHFCAQCQAQLTRTQKSGR